MRGMHSTEWGRKTHHESAPKTGLRAQLARGFHLTFASLRVLERDPRLMALPFLALVFTGFVSRVLGYGWPLATLFVLPTMVIEGLGPLRAFRRSRALLRERWGAHQKGVLGTGVVFLLLCSVGLVPFVYGILGDPGNFGWAVGAVLYWLVLSALWSVVHGILVATLYHYALESEAAFGFSWQALNHPWIR